ncbi:metal-sulfur cluster assembly factor [Aggregatilinea lenta]|uniref:metal-sulfur cluster assembly factor n=1 Tax=Aggregatilinea lenta TaxID=913108 RepID=UPI000E5A4248|nr:metal-sulfur cluster assembly factor [Aggregatilinea lenta]
MADETQAQASQTPETMSVEAKQDLVLTALREVYDPEIGLSVVELGLIREVQVQDDRLHIVMLMTTPFCPYAPQLLEAARRKGQDTLGLPTTIELGMGMWDPSMAEDGVLDNWGLF